jgi:hypothetical protein
MMGRTVVSAALLAVLVLAGSNGWAHRLLPDDGTHLTAETAIPVNDVSVSQVAYHEVAPNSPRVWLAFDAPTGQTLDIQVGVPVIERFRSLRPVFAVLGPGLPSAALPFAVPEGYGGWVFSTEGMDFFDTFHEEFTGTDSWRFPEQVFELPQSGKYYVVAYLPSADTGKFWIAVGVKESFTFSDILQLPATIVHVRQFHEVGPIGGVAMTALIALGVIAILLLFLQF